VSIVAEAWDDEALLAALRQAVEAMRDVPPEVIQAGKDAYAWRNVEAELAELAYDSEGDAAATASAETASVRALTFSAAQATIQLEVTGDSLAGQVAPARAATITVQPRTGEETELSADETGRFSVRPIPPVMFRLRVRAGSDVDVLTRWIAL
jgi:hypothetical protein